MHALLVLRRGRVIRRPLPRSMQWCVYTVSLTFARVLRCSNPMLYVTSQIACDRGHMAVRGRTGTRSDIPSGASRSAPRRCWCAKTPPACLRNRTQRPGKSLYIRLSSHPPAHGHCPATLGTMRGMWFGGVCVRRLFFAGMVPAKTGARKHSSHDGEQRGGTSGHPDVGTKHCLPSCA